MQALTRVSRRALAGLLALAVLACEGSTGPAGPAGPPGPEGPGGVAGPRGPSGSANAVLYQYGPYLWPSRFPGSAMIPRTIIVQGVTRQQMNESVWLVYLVNSSGRAFRVPGLGANGATQYTVFHEWASDAMHLRIAVANGIGESYAATHVIRIAAGAAGNVQATAATTRMSEPLPEADEHAAIPDHGIEQR